MTTPPEPTTSGPTTPERPAPADPSEPRWLRCYATEIASGDLLDIAGEHYRVKSRTHPPSYLPTFQITMPDGFEMTLFRSTRVKVFDPDGSVTARVHELPPEKR